MKSLKHADLDVKGTQVVKTYHFWQHKQANEDLKHMCEHDHGANSVWYLSTDKKKLTFFKSIYFSLGIYIGTFITVLTYLMMGR